MAIPTLNFWIISKYIKLLIRIATRKSPLALWQANYVGQQIKKILDQDFELVEKVTEGDTKLDKSLALSGGKGLFLKELQIALLNKEADIAVHSYKDYPTENNENKNKENRLKIIAVLPRDNPDDVFISSKFNCLENLPQNAIIGTSSLRRQGQILHHYPYLRVKLLRGNINSRIKKCEDGEYDAIILAKAGLDRLSLNHKINHSIKHSICLPAVTQGVMAVECLAQNQSLIEQIIKINCTETQLCADSERAFSYHLGTNCHSPIACYATISNDKITIQSVVVSPNGKNIIKKSSSGNKEISTILAKQLAQEMISMGALEILD